MSVIYSYIDISNEKLEEFISFINDEGQEINFCAKLPSDLVINMPFIGTDEQSNSQLWLRNSNYYFKMLLEKHPEYFSNQNIDLINNCRNPICDEQFVKYFDSYKAHIGETLVHHHIGGDGQAVAVPKSWHLGFGRIHNLEKELGIAANAQIFSTVVKLKSQNTKFSWNDEEKIQSILNDVKIVKQSYINNSNKKSASENINEQKNKNSKKLPPPAPYNKSLNPFQVKTHDYNSKLHLKSKRNNVSKNEINKLKYGITYKNSDNVHKEVDYPENREPPKRHYVNTYYKKNGVRVKGHYKGGKMNEQ